LTIALIPIIWKLADQVFSEPYTFMAQVGSVMVAVFFVFLLTPMIIWAGMIGLFVATYTLLMIGAVVATIYMYRADKKS
jgi:hypothetical protein